MARPAASLGDFERTVMVMMREWRWSSSLEPERADMISSSESVAAGWLERYSCVIIATILSERQSERRVLKISA